jgi:hypothetical protein
MRRGTSILRKNVAGSRHTALRLPRLVGGAVLALTACGGDAESLSPDDSSHPVASEAAALANNTGYVIANRNDTNCLDSVPKSAKCDASASQNFRLFDQGGGVWVIRNDATANKCLTYDPSLNGGKVFLEACNGTLPRQRWQLTSQYAGAELYAMKSQAGTNMCLDASLTALIQACNSSYWTQHWQLVRGPQTNLSEHPRINSYCARYITSTGAYPNIQWGSVWVDAAMANNPDCTSGGKIKAAQWWNSSETQTTFIPKGALPYNTNVFNFALNPNGDGTYTAAYRFDNQNYDNGRRDQFNFVSYSDSYDQSMRNVPLPATDDKCWVEFKIKITGHTRDAADPFHNKARVALFVMTTNDAGYQREFEYVLFRDGEYDGCTSSSTWWGPNRQSPCESGSLYDRRAAGGAGEYVYVSPGQLHNVISGIPNQPTLSANSTWTTFRLPFSRFMTKYAWKTPVTATEGARVAGLGIGIETLGKANTKVELRDFRTYATP